MSTPEFSLQFRMNNSAFAEDPAFEVARILREIADKVERGDGFIIGDAHMRPICDFNGNRIGEYCADLEDMSPKDFE
jgi:hypothetical protein